VEQKDSGVLFHGWLSDELLYMLYNRVKVVVAPLLSGAGVKGKVGGGPWQAGVDGAVWCGVSLAWGRGHGACCACCIGPQCTGISISI
jgi:glycosyltransferase involved in cell wall biosynthesis